MIPVYEINIYVGNHVSDWGIQEHIHSLQKLFEKDFHVSTSLSIREGVINVILDEFSDKKKTRNLIKVIKNFQNKNPKTRIILVASEFMAMSSIKNLTMNSNRSTRRMNTNKPLSILEKSINKFPREWLDIRGLREKRYFRSRAKGFNLFINEVQISLILSLHPRIQKQLSNLFPDLKCDYALQLPIIETFKFNVNQGLLIFSLGSQNRYRRKVKEKIAKITASVGVLTVEPNQIDFKSIKFTPLVNNMLDVFIPKNNNWHLNSPMRIARSSALNYLPITFNEIQDEFSEFLQIITFSEIFTDFSKENLLALISKYNKTVESYRLILEKENKDINRMVHSIAIK